MIHIRWSPHFFVCLVLDFVFLYSVIFVQAQWNPHWINKNNAAICVFSSCTCIPYGANLKTTFVHWISDGSLHEKGQLVQRIVVLQQRLDLVWIEWMGTWRDALQTSAIWCELRVSPTDFKLYILMVCKIFLHEHVQTIYTDQPLH